MSVLEQLARVPGVFWGEGTGPDRATYAVRVAVQSLPDGSVRLDYESWAPHAGLNHAEAARLFRRDEQVLLVTTSVGTGESLTFREGDAGVFGSTGPHRVGLVLGLGAPDALSLSWWWPAEDGSLREQSRALVRRCRPLTPPSGAETPAVPPGGCDGPDDEGAGARREGAGADADAALDPVPWPGIIVLDGPGTGVVAHRLAERLTRVAVVRTDLFDEAVRGMGAAPDAALRERVAVAVVGAYAGAAHPVILYRRGRSSEQRELVDVLAAAGLHPVRLVEVADGEGYGEVARRLIEAD
jgi:hypothetical protein